MANWYAFIEGKSDLIAKNISINRSLTKQNQASVTIDAAYGPGIKQDQVVHLYTFIGSIKYYGFKGVISKVSTSETNCEVLMEEPATELYKVYCTSESDGIFKPRMMIRNPGQISREQWNTVGTYETTIRSTPNPSGGGGFNKTGIVINPADYMFTTHSDYSLEEFIPGTTERLPTFVISHMTIGRALYKFLKEICGYNIWYDYDEWEDTTDPIILGYGFKRQVISASDDTPVITNSKIGGDTLGKVGSVMVLSSNDKIPAGKYVGNAAIKREARYRIDAAYDQKTLEHMAKVIYNDRLKEDNYTYQMKFPICRALSWHEGDVFAGLGDETIPDPMPWKQGTLEESNDGYQIMDMNISDSAINIIVGSSYRSVFDVYKSTLSLVDGADTPTETEEYIQSSIDLSPISSTSTPADPPLDITSKKAFYLLSASTGDISIVVGLKEYPEDTVEIPYQTKSKKYITSLSDTIIPASSFYEFDIEVPIDDLPPAYDHGDIEVNYTVKSTGDPNGVYDLTWDCYMEEPKDGVGDVTWPDGFENVAPLEKIVQGRDATSNHVQFTNTGYNAVATVGGVTGTAAIDPSPMSLTSNFIVAAWTKPQPETVSGFFPHVHLIVECINSTPHDVTLSKVDATAIFYYYDENSPTNSGITFTIETSGRITCTPIGYTNITRMEAHYYEAHHYSYPKDRWEVVPMTNTMELIPSSSPEKWQSTVVVSGDTRSYWSDHTNDAAYSINVTGDSPSGSTKTCKFADGKIPCIIKAYPIKDGVTYYNSVIIQVLPDGDKISADTLSKLVKKVNCLTVIKDLNSSTMMTDAINVSEFPKEYKKYIFGTDITAIVSRTTALIDGCESTETPVKNSVDIMINDDINDKVYTVYDGEALRFSGNYDYGDAVPEDVTDSTDIFYYGYTTPNIIKVVDSKKKWLIDLKISSSVYKDMYVIDDENVVPVVP